MLVGGDHFGVGVEEDDEDAIVRWRILFAKNNRPIRNNLFGKFCLIKNISSIFFFPKKCASKIGTPDRIRI